MRINIMKINKSVVFEYFILKLWLKPIDFFYFENGLKSVPIKLNCRG